MKQAHNHIDRLRLAEEIAKISHLEHDDGRRDLIQVISNTLNDPLNVRASANPRLHIYHIIDACAGRPEGLEALARALDFVQPRCAAAAYVRNLIMPQAGRHLSDRSSERVATLLTNLPNAKVAEAFRTASGSGWDPTTSVPTDAEQAFRVLLDANSAQRRIPCHLHFMEIMAGALDGSVYSTLQGEIHAWVDEQIAAFEEPERVTLHAHLSEIRSHVGRPSSPDGEHPPVYLVIGLEPYEQSSHLYRLSHWVHMGTGPWSPVRGEDRVLPMEDAPAAVGKLIRFVESNGAYEYPGSMIVEFVLPLKMMNLEVDQWLVDPPDEPAPRTVGMRYVTVIRNLERLRREDLHREWRERWGLIRLEAKSAFGENGFRAHWVAGGKPVDLSQLERVMGDRAVVCCGLERPPSEREDWDALWVMLRGGVPVIIWCRETDDTAGARGKLADLIHEGISELRITVQALRRDAAGGDPRLGRHLTLVWDDFDRSLRIGERMRAPLETRGADQ